MHLTNKNNQKFLSSRFVLLALVAILSFSSCLPKIVFLEKHRAELEEAQVPLKLVQFYNDKEIILRRRAINSDYKESGGRIIEIDGEQIQEIKIKRGTPCLITGSKGGLYTVRFENGEGKTLRFYRNSKGAFQIDADKWKNRKGEITYAGLDFLIEIESNDVILLFKERRKYRSKPESRTIKGQKAHR